MMISKCEWHRLYWGDSKLLGVAAWWPLWKWETTGGMCHACSLMFRAENGLPQRSEPVRVLPRLVRRAPR